MPISTANNAAENVAAGHRVRQETNGFTLTEILVVVFLIGLASAAVLLSVPGDTAKLRDSADRFAARIAAARDSAVMGSQPVAVWLRRSGYGFERQSRGVWQAAEGKSFTQQYWPDGTTAGQTDTRVIFDATGLPSAPLHIVLRRGEAEIGVDISAAGEVSVAP
jgi:general secretion pathway protein H